MVVSRVSSKKTSHDDSHIHLSSDKGQELSSTLHDIREKEKELITSEEAHRFGFPYINLANFPIPQDALLMLDRGFCERERMVCFYFENEQIRLGALDPTADMVLKKAAELEEKFRSDVAIYKISEDSLRVAFKKYDAIPKTIRSREEGFELSEEALKKQQEKVTSIKELNEAIAVAPVTELLALIIGAAMKANASDIHIEAEADDIKVRMRIDGVLHDLASLPRESWNKVVSRIKLISALKLNIIDQPQDGRFTILLTNDKIEVRVSTVPTSYGESVVMRLLRFSIESLAFPRLGLTGFTLSILEQEIGKPNGMIIATGPTGSGKTTTLYAILHKLNDPGTKILTLEDPVEYKIKGVNQTQINVQAGVDFAKGLRSLLRQDPDIIMVGEIRDLETADTAINAALTGHLMLSTLHTNSAAGAIPRFIAMGSKPFLLAPSINAIIGQRLVRRLCEHCKTEDHPTDAIRQRIQETLDPIKSRTDLGVEIDLTALDTIPLYTATGCKECNEIGYRGRIGIFEILTVNKDLEKTILAGNVSEYEIQELAQSHGMITMVQDGLLKVLAGITSVSEVFKQAE